MSRIVNTVRSMIGFVRLAGDLDRLDDVFEMAATLQQDREIMAEGVAFHRQRPDGRAALAARPRVGTLDLAALQRLPAGTLGRVYADHMVANKLDPSALPLLPSRDELEFIFAHYYETHDIWHAVTGYATDKAGELGLQGFYMAQGPARLSAMILAAGFLNMVVQPGQFEDRDRRFRAIVHGWLLGRRAKNLFGVKWTDLWNTPLADVRAMFGIDLPAVDALLGEDVSFFSPIARPELQQSMAA